MKNILISLFIVLSCSCCKKIIVDQQKFVEAIIYIENIKYTNYNEPNKLHVYVVSSKGGKGFWYCQNTTRIIDFKEAQWLYSVKYPVDVKSFHSEPRIGIDPHHIPGYFTTN